MVNPFTLTVVFCVLVHPLESVAVTVYVVVTLGLTVIEAVVALLLQTYDIPPDAVNVVLSFIHIFTSPVIVTVGNGLIFTNLDPTAEQPFVPVTVTEYVVGIPGVTVIEADVAPFNQR